jgi:hypothetical protein
LARPSWVLFSLVLLGLVRAPHVGSAQTSVNDLPVYRGPIALYDLDDPLYSVRWTLGNPEPMRWLLNMPSNLALHQLLTYETDQGRVYRKYLAGEQEILPPLGFTPEEYANESFHEGLTKAWIKETGNSLKESKDRGGAPEGLINLDLPNLPFASKVFGDGAPNLRVRGSEQITVSGSSSWVVGQVTGEQGGNSLFPKLDMRQRLNVNLDGTIGSKLSVSMAQNSDALTPLENSIRIRYKGLDDEVLKTVELGNTNLSLPSTQFISYSTRQEGLFGVKTEAEVGGVSLTAIASREQGQAGQSTFNGGSAQRTIRISDWQYVEGKYFFLINPNDPNAPTGPITKIHLYLDDKDPRNNVERGALKANVWLDPRTQSGPTIDGQFHLLSDQEDYTIPNDLNFSFPRIDLTNQLSQYQTLAVAYIQTVGAVSETVGTWIDKEHPIGSDSTLVLKMLRPSDDQWGGVDLRTSPWGEVRYLEAKNVYSLQAQDIEPGSLTLDVVRDQGGSSNDDFIDNESGKRTTLLQLLGLDQKNNTDPSNRIPDQRIDPEFVNLEKGLITFPDLRPFDPDLADIEGTPARARSWPRDPSAQRPDILGWQDDGTGGVVPSSADVRSHEVVPEIYDLRHSELTNTSLQHHLFTIQAQVKAAISTTIDLGALGGVLQNSETVRLNGQELRKGDDYTIDYDTGIVTLRKPEATAPGADLVITYSQDALFQRGSHSLFGASLSTGQRDPNGKFALSSTWLHESRGVPDRRPRLNGEPTRTTVGDFSGRLRLTPWLLTDLVDKLPLVHANTPSRLELNAAMGVSFPNPNTRGEVYLDDMEGAEQTVSTGVSRVNWFYSSRPLAYRDHTFTDSTLVDLNDVDRGELLWFSPNNVDVGDVTPREDSQQARNDPVPALEVIYIPSDSAGVEKSWGGLVTSLANADVSRKQYLQVWLNDNIPIERANERRGEVLIDIGEVSEDAVWDPQTPPAPADSILNLEDLNQNGGQAEVDEDRGLDYKKNENEPARRSGTKTFSPKSPTQDPAGDDRLENPDENAPENTITQRIKKYGGINGTEGNQRLDTEDLNGDYQLERNNQYAEYRISLADSAFIDNRRDFPKGIQDLRSGWRMYRIPLTKIDLQKGGNPDLTQIRHLRMWFRGIAPGDTLDLQVASVEIVGNSWELESLRTDDPTEVLNVGVANNKENADYIEPPIEVRRIDNVKEKEQSISLNFENMQAGRDFRAFKRLQNIFDYTLYQSIGFFLNPRFQEIPTDTLEFYMRFGSDPASDTTSYYEVATRITQNDLRRNADGWIDVQFKVADLSQFKIGKSGFIPPNEYLVGPADTPTVDPTDSTRIIPPRANIDNGLLVTVRGSPSISRVGRLSVGLRNISGHSLSKGSVWYDELRMGDVRRDMGWAGTVRASMTLADFADVQGSVDLTNPDFLRLGDSRGSGTENLHYDFRGQVGLHKFMEPLHVTAPLSWRMSKQRLTPKFIPNNDILFEGDRSTGNEITEVADQGVDLSLSRDARGLGNPFLRYTVDALRLSGSYGKTSRDDVTRDDWARRLNGSASYNLGLGDIGPLRPLGLMSFWLWPRSVQLGLTGARVDTRSWTPFDSLGTTYLRPAPESITKTENLNLSTTVQPISGLTYTFATDRDLIGDHFGTNSSSVVLRDRSPLTVGGVDLGRAVQVNHNLAFAYQPPLLSRILSPRFSWSSGSNQNLQPSLTLEDYDHAVFDIANTNNATVSLTIPLSRITETSVRGPTGRVIKPNRPGHREKADTTEVSAKAQDVSLRQFFTKILKLRDIQATGGLGHRSAYSRMYGDPSIEYRLGLTRAPGDSVFNEPNAANNSAIGRNTSLRGTTSVTLLGQVDVDMSFQKSNDRTDMNSRGGLVKDTVTWPDLRFDWGDLQKKIPLIRRLSDFRIVNTSFNRTTETVGTLTNPDESTTITNRWSPLVSITGTLPGDWKTTLNASLSSTEIQSNREGGAPTVSNRNQNQYQMSLNKRFVGSGGNSKKDVDVKIDMSYSSNSSVTQGSRIQADKSAQLRMTSSATVRLTTALSGTFGLELGQESRPTSNWTRRSVRLSFTTGFNF